MPIKFCLESGHVANGGLDNIDREIIDSSKNKRMLVLNLASYGFEKTAEKQKILMDHFRGLGIEEIYFIDNNSPKDGSGSAFAQAGLLYLSGGNPEIMIDSIRARDLVGRIRKFEGVVFGNSAGTYALCPDYLKMGKGGEPRVVPSLGIVPFWTKCHYGPRFDEDLKKLSEGREIFAMEDPSTIIVEDGVKKFVGPGNVWKFSEGLKEKVS